MEPDFIAILHEVVQFLEKLRDVKLPSPLENLRKDLLIRTRNTFPKRSTESPESYIYMARGKAPANNANEKDTEYVPPEERQVSYPEEFVDESFPDSQDSTSEDERDEVTNDSVALYSNYSVKQAKERCEKAGHLRQKREGISFFKPEYRDCWAVLMRNHLLLYNGERDIKPFRVLAIQDYEGRPALNVKHRGDSAFEIFSPGKPTMQFIAQTPMDMEQWLTKISHVGRSERPYGFRPPTGSKSSKSPPVLPPRTIRPLPSVPQSYKPAEDREGNDNSYATIEDFKNAEHIRRNKLDTFTGSYPRSTKERRKIKKDPSKSPSTEKDIIYDDAGEQAVCRDRTTKSPAKHINPEHDIEDMYDDAGNCKANHCRNDEEDLYDDAMSIAEKASKKKSSPEKKFWHIFSSGRIGKSAEAKVNMKEGLSSGLQKHESAHEREKRLDSRQQEKSEPKPDPKSIVTDSCQSPKTESNPSHSLPNSEHYQTPNSESCKLKVPPKEKKLFGDLTEKTQNIKLRSAKRLDFLQQEVGSVSGQSDQSHSVSNSEHYQIPKSGSCKPVVQPVEECIYDDVSSIAKQISNEKLNTERKLDTLQHEKSGSKANMTELESVVSYSGRNESNQFHSLSNLKHNQTAKRETCKPEVQPVEECLYDDVSSIVEKIRNEKLKTERKPDSLQQEKTDPKPNMVDLKSVVSDSGRTESNQSHLSSNLKHYQTPKLESYKPQVQPDEESLYDDVSSIAEMIRNRNLSPEKKINLLLQEKFDMKPNIMELKAVVSDSGKSPKTESKQSHLVPDLEHYQTPKLESYKPQIQPQEEELYDEVGNVAQKTKKQMVSPEKKRWNVVIPSWKRN